MCSLTSFASKRLPGVALFAVTFFLSTLSFAQMSFAQQQESLLPPRPLITQAVDETQLTVLKGNTHPLARPEFDLGTAPATLPMQRMLLVLKRSAEQESALRKLLDDQQDKASPNYHKWLTPEQFGKQFGPSDADMQTISGWLQSHGFQVGSTKGRTVLEFSGSASQVQEAFHTTIHKYLVNEEQHWANANDPAIPAALTPAVAGVMTLHNFLKKPAIHVSETRFPAKFRPKSRPQFTASNGLHALVPEDYATIYNATTVHSNGIDGAGTSIAVVARSDLFNGGSDVSDFRSIFGLGGGSINPVLNGPDPGDLGGGEELEATLDVSWSGALAPAAQIDFVVSATTNTTDGVDLSELYIIENNLANVMTESFSFCEAAAGLTGANAQGISLLAEQAAAQGITYMLAAGDTGAEGCDNLGETVAQGPVSVSVLASTPFTVAVGGTMFNENGQDTTYWNVTDDNVLGSALSYIPEDVWNETCTTQCQTFQPPLAAGGGGASVFFTKPPWQVGVTGIPAPNARYIPDVSLSAAGHDPYLLCVDASCVPDANNNIFFFGVEGTSASTPSFAGVMALVDQKMGQVQGPSGSRQGQADYVLYSLASTQQKNGTLCDASNTSTLPNSACVFNDITVGNNSVPGESGYPSGSYNAGAGYDLASGLGSVNVSNLVNAWANATFRATTTTLKLNSGTTLVTITHGQSVNIGVSVAPNSGTGTPKGDVSLIAATTATGLGVPPTAGLGQQVFTLNAGSVAGATTQLPGGDYTLTAHYAGDGTFAPSDSAPGIPVAVTAENSTTKVSGVDQNGNPIVGSTLPFGFGVFVRADVAGALGIGIPTGMVNFTDTFGTLPGQIFNPVANPVALNSEGNTSIGAGVINFDAGNHSISAAYAGDPSFNPSKTASPVSFTIQPGFAGVSGPTDVTIASPGLSGTSTVGIIASSGFSAISFTCVGLPAEAACVSTPLTGNGPNTVVNTNITVTTTAPHITMLQPNQRPYFFAAIFGGALPLGGIFLLASPRRRRAIALLGIMALTVLVTLSGCGGGGSSHRQDPGTPVGTYTVQVTATAGSLSQQGSFTLTVQ